MTLWDRLLLSPQLPFGEQARALHVLEGHLQPADAVDVGEVRDYAVAVSYPAVLGEFDVEVAFRQDDEDVDLDGDGAAEVGEAGLFRVGDHEGWVGSRERVGVGRWIAASGGWGGRVGAPSHWLGPAWPG